MIVSVVSQKGGVGKTTIAAHVAAGLAGGGREVLLVDLDPQGHAGIVLGVDGRAGVHAWLVERQRLQGLVVGGGRPRLRMLLSDKSVGVVGSYLELLHSGAVPRDLLARGLGRALQVGLDVCVFDTAPTVSTLQALALAAADLVIVPVGCDLLSHHALAATVGSLSAVGGSRRVLVVPTFYDGRTRHSRDMLAGLRDWSARVLGPVHRATVIRDASQAGRTVFEFAPTSRAAGELGSVVDAVAGVCDG